MTPALGSKYPAGTIVSIEAKPDAGWQFTSWGGDLTGTTNPTTITMNGDKNVIANFTQSNNPPTSPPSVPTSFTAGSPTLTTISLSWTKGKGATNTYVERNTVSSWIRGVGTFVYNNTGTSTTDSSLSSGTIYYYEAWSWANSGNYKGYSTSYASANAKTSIKNLKYERYADTRTDAYNIYGARWKAQTFTVGNTGSNVNHYVNNVSLYLEKVGSPTGYFNVSIKAVASGKPTGADLAFGQILCSSVSAASYGWYSISFTTPYLLSANTKYCIVGRADSCTSSSNEITWGDVSSTGAYGGGTLVSSTDSGASWTISSMSDFLFQEWGYT